MRTRNVPYDPGANFEFLFPDAMNALADPPSAPQLRAMVRAATACAKRASASGILLRPWDRSTPTRLLLGIAELGARHAFRAARSDDLTYAAVPRLYVDDTPSASGQPTVTVTWQFGIRPKEARKRLHVTKVHSPEFLRLSRMPDESEVHAVVQRLDPTVASSECSAAVLHLWDLPLLGSRLADVASEFRDVYGAGVEAGDPAPIALSVKECEAWFCSASPLARRIAFTQLAQT